MITNLKPNSYAQNIYCINYYKLHENGIKYAVFDVDATILPFNKKEVSESDEILFRYINNVGIKAGLFSSNLESRVKPIAKALNIKYKCQMPKPFASFDFVKKMFDENCTQDNTVFIGDSFFFDMIFAEKCHVYKILVDTVKEGKSLKLSANNVLQAIMYNLVVSKQFKFKRYYKGYLEK